MEISFHNTLLAPWLIPVLDGSQVMLRWASYQTVSTKPCHTTGTPHLDLIYNTKFIIIINYIYMHTHYTIDIA